MPKKILIVTKDRAEFQLYHLVAKMFGKMGFEVTVVAEGLSMAMWTASGRQIYHGLPALGSFEPNTLTRTDVDPTDTLNTLHPDLVLTGLGAPINLGEKFGLAANRLGIKLGFVEDLWGVHKRSQATPQFICTPDEYGNKMILQSMFGGLYKTQVTVYVTGSPAMDTLQNVVPDASVAAVVNAGNFHRVILIGGQDESTTPLVQGLKEAASCVKNERWLILPRFHPKWMTDESKRPFRDEWTKSLDEISARHPVLWTQSLPDMRTLIPLATHVVSIYSNCLIEAVGMGAVPISWTSDIGRQKMKESLGVERFPAVDLGACLEVKTPQDFLHLGLGPEDLSGAIQTKASFIKNAQQVLGLDGHATERVVKVILEYIQ